jgi:uncharacterized membrane protein (DUF4010 family)
MLVRATLIISIFNRALLDSLFLAFAVAFVISLGVVAFFYLRSKQEEFKTMEIEYKNPFDLKEALILGLFFGLVIALVKLAKEYVGDSGVYVVSFVSGISDVDAIILSLSDIAGRDIDIRVASIGIAAAVITNNVTKFLIAYSIGTRGLAKTVGFYYLFVCSALTVLVL